MEAKRNVICAGVDPSVQIPMCWVPSQTGPGWSTLDNDSLLDLTVDGAELLVHDLLGLVDETADAGLHILDSGAGLVAALGEDVGVVG